MKKLLYILYLSLLPFLSFSQQVVELCEGYQTTFTYKSDGGRNGLYVWNIEGSIFLVEDLIYTWDATGDYEIKLVFISTYDCRDTITYNVSVIPCQETTIYFPNSFTPNGDNFNEVWEPKGLNYTDLEFMVYTRWGQIIFKSNPNLLFWDGKINGVQCQEDVYTVIVKWRGSNRVIKSYVGRITLIK